MDKNLCFKNKRVEDLFVRQAKNTPNSIALICDNKTLTYEQLDKESDKIATMLMKQRIKSEELVGIFLSRTVELIIALLGVLKAGAAYIPLDPKYPSNRIKYMIDNSRLSTIISEEKLIEKLYGIKKDINLLQVEDRNGFNLNTFSGYINSSKTSNDIAYVIYTSGSTGNPKGVMIQHSALINFINGVCEIIDFKHGKAILALTTVCFDIFFMETILPLCKGLTVIMANEEEESDPNKILKLIIGQDIDMIQMTPSRLTMFINSISSIGMLRNIEEIMVGGEVFPENLLGELRKLSATKIYNLYGPTEATVWSTIKNIDVSGQVTIGTPMKNTGVYIIDEGGKKVNRGEVGEIYIYGDGLSKGYLNNLKLTEEKFVQNIDDISIRMYRTGDLGRYLENGEIECLGRVDNQVKVRGYRIELEEIEANLNMFKDIKISAVKPIVEDNRITSLCAFYVADYTIEPLKLRQFLSQSIPEYMIPSTFIKIDRLATTLNGKIDRKAISIDEKINLHNRICRYPENEIQKKLLNIWEKNFAINSISIDDDFFQIGGHSLKAASIAVQMHRVFNIYINPSNIMKLSSIENISNLIGRNKKESYKADEYNSIEKTITTDTYPVSSMQRRLLVLESIHDTGTSYNVPVAFNIYKDINIKRLEASTRILINKYEILRTSFEFNNGQYYQKIDEDIDFNIEYYDSKDKDIDDITKKFIRKFNLDVCPLFRLALIKVNSNKSILLFDIHHTISDGISVNILINELLSIYNGVDAQTSVVQYGDFVKWHESFIKSQKVKEEEKYWINVFQNQISVLNLPYDFPRPSIQKFDGDRVFLELSQEEVNQIKQFTRENKLSLFMVLISAYSILLSKLSRQEDIIIGSPIHGRVHSDIVKAPGMFVNTINLRTIPIGNMKIKKFLHNIKDISLESYENQNYQYEELVGKLDIKRDLSRNPLFDVMFIYQNQLKSDNIENFEIKPHMIINKASKFDLTLEVIENNSELLFSFEYATSLFKRSTILRFTNYYKNILGEIIKNIDVKISDIKMIDEGEKEDILYRFNNTDRDYDENITIHHMIDEQAKKTPEKIALEFNDKKISYEELSKKSSSFALKIKAMGIDKEDIIPVILDRTPELIITLLAVLKAGAAYLPIDPEFPKERIIYILEDCNARLVITNKSYVEIVKEYYDYLAISDDESIYENEYSNYSNISNGNDLAYIIYTSGSTGVPKGVMIEHKALVNFVIGMKEKINFKATDKILALTTISFDIFFLEVFLPLTIGMKIVIADETSQKDAQLLSRILSQKEIDILQVTPSRMKLLLNGGLDFANVRSLKTLIFGGEPLPYELYKNINDNTNIEIFNVYGPTETTIWSTVKKLNDAKKITIGNPIANTRIYIMDKELKLCPIGLYGEICIAGKGVARGYFNRDKLTKEKFIPENSLGICTDVTSNIYRTGDIGRWLETGEIEILGRNDGQVKIRGYRIEIGEIENTLLKNSFIRECTVAVKTRNTGDKYLVAYYTTHEELTVNEIKDYLAKIIPLYMIPEFFIYVKELPMTQNGKIDKNKLPDPSCYRPKLKYEFVEAETKTEKRLFEIWQDVLQNNEIGIYDNFFDIGGNSLLLVAMTNYIEKEFHINISVADMFSYSNIFKIAQFIDGKNRNINLLNEISMIRFTKDYFIKDFTKENNTEFDIKITGNIFEKILNISKELKVNISSLLLAILKYLIFKTFKQSNIQIQTLLNDKGLVLPISTDMSSINNTIDLIKEVDNKVKTIANDGYYSLSSYNVVFNKKEPIDVLISFGYKNNYLITDQYDIDINFKISITNDYIDFHCDYNSMRLKKEKIYNLIMTYMHVIKLLTNK